MSRCWVQCIVSALVASLRVASVTLALFVADESPQNLRTDEGGNPFVLFNRINDFLSSFVENARDLQEAVSTLRSGQIIRIDNSRPLILHRALRIDRDDVVIRSTLDRKAKVACSPTLATGAIRIKGDNVSLESLTLSGCNGASAIEILHRANAPDSAASRSLITIANVDFYRNGHSRDRVNGSAIQIHGCTERGCTRRHVLIRNCNFENNRGLHGGAIYAVGTRLSIQNSRFVGNEATLSGGAVHHSAKQDHLKITDTIFDGNALVRVTADGETPPGHLFHPVLGKGGALFVSDPKEAKLESLAFSNNMAYSAGGALMIRFSLSVGTATIERTVFESNAIRDNRKEELVGFVVIDQSIFGGGALALVMERILDAEVIVKESFFTDNRAHFGGGLHITGSIEPVIRLQSTVFDGNNATGGGAITAAGVRLFMQNITVKNCKAVWGGGVHISSGTNLTMEPHSKDRTILSVFENNKAILGGGIIVASGSVSSLHSLIIRNNIAFVYGGGIHAVGASSLRLSASTISNNVASVGGGFASIASPVVEIVGSDDLHVMFKKNKAFVGGGFYFVQGPSLPTLLKVEKTDFRRNEAVEYSFNELFQYHEEPQIYQPTEFVAGIDPGSFIGAERSGNVRLLDALPYRQRGHGGGFAVNLLEVAAVSRINVALSEVAFHDNEAIVGGAMSVHLSDLFWNLGMFKTCFSTDFDVRPCQRFYLLHVKMTQNRAQYGGGIFVTHPEYILVACSEEEISPNMTLERVLTMIPETPGRKLDPKPNLKCLDISENFLIEGLEADGADVGTSVKRLMIDQATESTKLKTIASGELLSLPCLDSPDPSCIRELAILVVDSFNQTISRGINDSSLEMTVLSKDIAGDTRYRAERGRAVIDNTSANGIGKDSEVVIFNEQRPEIHIRVEFSTRNCYIGEEIRGLMCSECPLDTYSFDPTIRGCRQCENGGQCKGGSSLIPMNGFWHSNPFSPQMHRCIYKEACDNADRLIKLNQYYSNKTRLLEGIEQMKTFMKDRKERPNFDDYRQCAVGFHGPLCGSCSSEFGHSLSGVCEKCPSNVSKAGFLLAVMFFWTFVLIGTNCLMVLMSTSTRVEIATYDADEYTLQRNHRILRRTRNHIHESSVDIAMNGRNQIIADPLTTDDLEARRMCTVQLEATIMLTESFKVLINYLQVTSSAGRLSVNWRSGLSGLFSTQAILTGGVAEAVSIPLECSLPSDMGISPSISGLWLRILVPVLVLWTLLVIYALIWWRTRVDEAKSADQPPDTKHGKKLVTGSIVIFVVSIYFSYIDNVREFVRTLNCVSVDADQSNSGHPYQVYAIETESRVWAEDTTLACFKGDHLVTGIVGVVGLISSVGVILFIVILPTLYPSRALDSECVARFWYLYQGYRKEKFVRTWEAVVLIRKALIASILVFSYGLGTSLQASLCVGVLIVAFAMQTTFQPYRDPEEHSYVPVYAGSVFRRMSAGKIATAWIEFNNKLTLNSLESASLFSSTLVFYTATILADSNSSVLGRQAIVLFALLVNLIFMLYIMYRLYCGVHVLLDAKLEKISSNPIATIGESMSPIILARKAFQYFSHIIATWDKLGTS